MTFGTVNFFAVLIAAIIKMIIGYFWYSPKGFGELWAKEALHKPIEECKCSILHLIAAFIIALITAWTLALLINWMNVQNIAQGAALAFFIWLGFIATSHLSGVVWGQVRLRVYLINMGYLLLSLVLMSLLLSLWR